ncbi:hypothetical protein [Pseudomonas sp. 31-12]|uniref:hypothetical protein n=1 Tax=Pseudomonas sp. 31-12 TaxID=2201356 RepID=UPI0013A59F56|nr:hypothetical protein [Pseudomonas sp. 31-12]
MHHALLIIDVQPNFDPPQWLLNGVQKLIKNLPRMKLWEHHFKRTVRSDEL